MPDTYKSLCIDSVSETTIMDARLTKTTTNDERFTIDIDTNTKNDTTNGNKIDTMNGNKIDTMNGNKIDTTNGSKIYKYPGDVLMEDQYFTFRDT